MSKIEELKKLKEQAKKLNEKIETMEKELMDEISKSKTSQNV